MGNYVSLKRKTKNYPWKIPDRRPTKQNFKTIVVKKLKELKEDIEESQENDI